MTDSFIPFLVAAILLTVTPGPDQIYIVSRTLAQGRLVGLVSSWGVCTGAAVHIIAAALGFSVIIQTSAFAYAFLKYAGAAYLLWLGINAFRQQAVSVASRIDAPAPCSRRSVFLQGVLVDICNPKVALFFLAFLPQFIPADAPDQMARFLMLGAVVIGIGLVWEAFLVIMADLVLGSLLTHSRFVTWLNNGMGAVFIGLALHVLFSDDTSAPEGASPA